MDIFGTQQANLGSILGLNSIADVYNEPYVEAGWDNSQYSGILESPYGDIYGMGIDIPFDMDELNKVDTEPEPAMNTVLTENKNFIFMGVLFAGVLLALIT